MRRDAIVRRRPARADRGARGRAALAGARPPRERSSLACDNALRRRAAPTAFAPLRHPESPIPLSPYELAVGLRYTRARRGSGRNTFISFIALISMAGIALGVAALIVVLSVMNGFQEELRNADPRRRLAHRDPRHARRSPTTRPSRAAALEDPRVKCGRAVRARPGDALGGRRQPRRAGPRHRSGARGRRSPTSASTCAQARSTRSSPASSASSSAPDLARALGVRLGDTVVVITPQGTFTRRRHAAAAEELHRWSACSRSACTSSTAGSR